MAPERREWLVVRAPGAPEQRVPLAEQPIRIGRGPDNQLVLADEYVSVSHAEIVHQKGRRRLRDLGSTNGTSLNGRPLAPDKTVALRDGDVLQLGSCTLTYRDGVEPDGAAASDRTTQPVAAPARGRGLTGALLRALLVVVAVLLVVLGALWVLAPPRLSVLVLGSDARPDELRRGESGRTDTLLTVVADRPPGGVALVSLPRDLWVAIPGHGEERINTAYALGGPETAKRAVRDVLGAPIDRYLLIGLAGVRDLVDAVGGIEVEVLTPIHDEAYPTDDYGTMVVDIPAGRQRMDGETALRYARTRHQDSDFGRVARQQQVLLALRSALLRPVNWWRAPAVVEAARRATRTDLAPLDLLALGLALGGAPSEPERLVVSPPLVEPFGGANGAYLLLPTPGLRAGVAAFLTPSQARVEVLNGTQTSGLARQAAETLRAQGLRIVRAGDAPRPAAVTSVEARPGAGRAGRLAAATLGEPLASVREVGDLPDDLDLRVTLGEERATR